jgi:hypothetical protein
MPLRKLLKALTGGKADAPRPKAKDPRRAEPARAPAPPQPEPLWIELDRLAAAWSKASSRLGVRTHTLVKKGEAVRLRITSKASGLDLTMDATAASVDRDGGGWLVSAAVDADGAALVERLLAVLRGESDPIAHRKPRYRLALPAVVTSGTGKTFMNTVSVSLDGCGLAWSGPTPRTGSGLFVQIGSGSRAVSFRAMTCWSRETARGARVGVRFVGGDRTAWTEILAQLSKDAERI